MPKKKKELFIKFAFDDLKILSATQDDVIVQGEEDDDKKCALFISRSMFYQMLNSWLDGKMRYFESTNGGFAGVGYIGITNYEKLKHKIHLNELITDDVDDFKTIEVPIKSYQVRTYYVEMEHG